MIYNPPSWNDHSLSGTRQWYIYSPTNVKHHLTCFNNIFSNNELIFQIGLLFSLPVHTYLLTCETGYWSIFIYVYMTGCVKCHVYFSTFVFANESWFFLCRVFKFHFLLVWYGAAKINHTRKVASCWHAITVVLAIEGWQTTSRLTIPSLYMYDWCSIFVKRGMLLTVHVQVDLAKRRRKRAGSYPDRRGNGRSEQLVHFVVI